MRMTIYQALPQQFFENLIHCTHWKIIFDQFITMLPRGLCIFKYNLSSFTTLSMSKMPLNIHYKRSDCWQSDKKIWISKKKYILMLQKRKDKQLKRDTVIKRIHRKIKHQIFHIRKQVSG